MVAVNRTRVIALWAVPRSRSTAFLRMIIERGDLIVVHEPFSNLAATGRFDVGGTTATSTNELFELLLHTARAAGRRLFVKETTDYRYDALLADARLRTEITNTFMIRDPTDVVVSHHAMNRAVERDDIGFERLYEMYEAVRDRDGTPPPVIDADDLVADPATVVARYCALTGLPFLPDALTWHAGPRPEWTRTEAWHRDVARSSGFTHTTKRHRVEPRDAPRLAELAAYQRPFYDLLYARRIRAVAAAGVSAWEESRTVGTDLPGPAE